MIIPIPTESALPQAAHTFLEALCGRNVVAFHAPMGAGKTTFIKAVCDALGVDDVVTSPTFAIVNEYTASTGEPVYHFDFYRLKKIEEAYDIGLDDYLNSSALCLIEWPELIADALPDDTVEATITVEPDGTRTLEIN